jgi:hypothetical protein
VPEPSRRLRPAAFGERRCHEPFQHLVFGMCTGDDARATQWIVRLVLSLLFWPDAGAHAEHQMLERFVAPAFAESRGSQSS